MPAPLLDLPVADLFFATTDPADIAEVRGMFAAFREDVPVRFTAFRQRFFTVDADAVAAQRELHGLVGVVANFACLRSAEHLRTLEHNWAALSSAGRADLLLAAETDFREGVTALLERYPHLG